MFDDDFSFLTGKQADLDNDGKVSFYEYMNDCDDYDRIKGSKPTGKYKPQQKSSNEHPKIYCSLGIVGWILAFIGCFMPFINTLIYTDGEGLVFGFILTAFFLASWIFCFSNRAK